jgi:catalase
MHLVLQARMFAYPDAARYRLGANYQQLPCNRPVAPVYCPYQRDGFATVNGNYGGDPNYVRSGLKAVSFTGSATSHFAAQNAKHNAWVMGSVADYTSEVTEEDFVQARMFWEKVLGRQPGQQEAFVGNVAAHLRGAKPVVWEATFGRWKHRLEVLWSGANDWQICSRALPLSSGRLSGKLLSRRVRRLRGEREVRTVYVR